MPEETLKAVPALARWSAQRGPEAVQAAVAGKPASRVSIRRPGPNRVGASRGWPRALERERCSGRIGASLSRRGPRRPRCPVVLSQSYGGHPAAATVRG